VAAKTGTTQNWHDGWTLGFTPSLAAGVWAGNNDGELLTKGADGVVVAAPIWHDFMQQALAGAPAEAFAVPTGIQQVTVDAVSGKLPTDATPTTKTETFASFSAPTTYDTVHVKVGFDNTTQMPATNLTPPANITYKTYTVLHSEMPNNPNWENPVVAWALQNGYTYPPGDAQIATSSQNSGQGPTITILDPADGQTITQTPFQVTINAVSANTIARIDLSIDGQFYESLNSQPFIFIVNKTLNDGPHVLAAHVVDSAGQTADTSADIIVDLTSPLMLTQPPDQSLLQFPTILSASSDKLYSGVSFYFTDTNGVTTLIGPASNIDHTGTQYNYTTTWQNAPAAGSYRIYAKTNEGITTKKILVSVP
jgi:membrane carboxypeptidase/penicillin-binding protein PbpC